MLPGQTFRKSFTLSATATNPPTVKLIHNLVQDTTVGTDGIINCIPGADPDQWGVSVVIPETYAPGDSIEFSATVTANGVTASSIVITEYISQPMPTSLTIGPFGIHLS